MIRGHLDRCDKTMLSGWVLDEADPDKMLEVEIIQCGQRICSIIPCFEAPNLRRALGLAPHKKSTYHFRIPFPLSAGLRADVPFDVRIAETGADLENGMNKKIPLCQARSRKAIELIENSTLFFPHINLIDASNVNVAMRISAPISGNGEGICLEMGNTIEDVSFLNWNASKFMGKPTLNISRDIKKADILESDKFCFPLKTKTNNQTNQSEISENLMFHEKLRTLMLPKTLFDKRNLISVLPDEKNIHRVSGPTSNQVTYLVSGITTFRQLNILCQKYFERSITEFDRIVDWGVGCGRVFRQFLEDPEHGILQKGDNSPCLIGFDIDDVNIDWCQKNLAHVGEISSLSLKGFNLPDCSVDLLYGISVMTHLSEIHQGIWLQEIARILKPGGGAILTSHGEVTHYQSPANFAIPFIEQFGFFDGIPDEAIGLDRKNYYRATYNDHKHIHETWSLYFEVLDIIPSTNAFRQDYIVLKKSS
jgi:SAM-dependent methyltransferase